MDTVLVVLGVLGFGAVVIAAYVFTVAARSYVSENDSAENTTSMPSASKTLIERNEHDRRQIVQLEFPITMNGILIPFDRRAQLDRRRAAA